MNKSNSKPKLKPANRYVSKEKVNEVKEKAQDIASSVFSAQTGTEHLPDADELSEDEEVFLPEYPPGSEPHVIPQNEEMVIESDDFKVCDISLDRFCLAVETTIITALNNRAEARRKAQEEDIRQKEAQGIDVITPENALTKCVKFINNIKESYDMYKEQKSAIAKEQVQIKETVKQQAETARRLEIVVGRIEKVQGVKAPKRPPFPSLDCLTYLFWHWPMYAYASMWQSKYFRRFCFLITFFVIVLQFCLICLLANDNKTLHYDRTKYITVRNWSFVVEDTSAINRFNRVDLLYEDVIFNKEQINGLNEFIRSKHEQNIEKYSK